MSADTMLQRERVGQQGWPPSAPTDTLHAAAVSYCQLILCTAPSLWHCARNPIHCKLRRPPNTHTHADSAAAFTPRRCCSHLRSRSAGSSMFRWIMRLKYSMSAMAAAAALSCNSGS